MINIPISMFAGYDQTTPFIVSVSDMCSSQRWHVRPFIARPGLGFITDYRIYTSLHNYIINTGTWQVDCLPHTRLFLNHLV